jgi:hypothetical protein
MSAVMRARAPCGLCVWATVLACAALVAPALPGVARAAGSRSADADTDAEEDEDEDSEQAARAKRKAAKRAKRAKAAERRTARKAKDDAIPETTPAGASQVTPLPVYTGLSAELLGGASAIPSPLVANRAIWDRYVGARVGWHRKVWQLQLGVEGAWRSTFLAYAGSRPIWFDALVQRASGNFPHQVIRWQNQVTGAGTVGWKYERMGFFVEPTLQLGMGASFRQVAVHLDQVGPYNRSLLTLGPLVGASFIMGIAPLFWRWDAIASSEFGPPPFTARYHTLQFNMSLGVRL